MHCACVCKANKPTVYNITQNIRNKLSYATKKIQLPVWSVNRSNFKTKQCVDSAVIKPFCFPLWDWLAKCLLYHETPYTHMICTSQLIGKTMDGRWWRWGGCRTEMARKSKRQHRSPKIRATDLSAYILASSIHFSTLQNDRTSFTS